MIEHKYDIFISYRSTDREWVDVLATNLRDSGYSIFLDDWEIRGGEDFALRIEGAIRRSKAGILVATPQASHSGWVQKEYELMQKEKLLRGFNFIPIVFGSFEHMPFTDTTHAIKFGDDYRRSFYKLVCSLEKRSADRLDSYAQELKYPTTKNHMRVYRKRFIEELFDRLTHSPQMVLSREHFNTGSYINSLKQKAIEVYGEGCVYSIYTPTALTDQSQEYFSTIAKQCGLEGVDSPASFGLALSQKFVIGKKILLLISGFENGDDNIRRAFAQNLRELYNHHQNSFDLVIFGGYKLIELRYIDGGLSPLNILEEYLIPEPSLEDWQEIFNTDIDIDRLAQIEERTGKHPKLTHYCISHSFEELDENDLLLSSIFSRFYHRSDTLCEHLLESSFGRFKSWSPNPLHRELFWQNLLIKDGKRFAWRSDYIRDKFREELECGE